MLRQSRKGAPRKRPFSRLSAAVVAAALSMVVVGGSIVVAPLASASVASSASVINCGGQTVCVVVNTGAKNTSNHTQLISSIEVDGAWSGLLEAWIGNGPTGVAWYASARGQNKTWYPNVWAKSGSGVCGALTASGRQVSCISISV
jgi:hypothetical protein